MRCRVDCSGLKLYLCLQQLTFLVQSGSIVAAVCSFVMTDLLHNIIIVFVINNSVVCYYHLTAVTPS
jgi:hypothetical protein